MVDQFGFAGSRGDLCQRRRIGQHIDQGGLADIRTANEGKFVPIIGRTLRELLAAATKSCGGNIHVGKF